MKPELAVPDIVKAAPTFQYLAARGVPRKALLVLHQAGAHDPFSILSVLRSFPSLADRGLLDAAEISHQLIRRDNHIATRISRAVARKARSSRHVFGAGAPASSTWQRDTEVPVELNGALSVETQYDVSVGLDGCGEWPVRNQAERGTCVAFAVAALYEHALCRNERKRIDLSEQFLQWSIKTAGDHWPDDDGTAYSFALDALRRDGICEENLWPYHPRPISGNVAQADEHNPSGPAITDASVRKWKGAIDYGIGQKGKNARIVLNLLRQGRPVGISLPVFRDPLSGNDNWSTPAAEEFGVVANPFATSVVDSGHAVCVTGFVADPLDRWGGYFVFRNSWSDDWGYGLPAPDGWGPKAGYGQVSASYVDDYLYEFASF